MNTKVHELLNQQINKEFYSAYLYLDFSNYFYDQELNGFGNWYRIQAQEERDHAMLFLQYLQNNGEHVTLEAIDKLYAAMPDGDKVQIDVKSILDRQQVKAAGYRYWRL